MAKKPSEIYKRAMDMLDSLDEDRKRDKDRVESERRDLVTGIGNQLVEMVRPLVELVIKLPHLTKEDITDAISQVKIQVAAPKVPEIKVPEIKIPPVVVPAPHVTVNPDVKIDGPVTVEGEVGVEIKGHSIDPKKALPVVLTDQNGRPYYAGMIGGASISGSKIRFQGVDAQGIYRTALVDEGGRLQVDVITGGGGGTQYQEDTQHASGDTGTLSLAVRNDAGGALATTDGDYIPFTTDNNGNLRVAISGFTATVESHLVTPSGQTIIDEGFDAAQIVSAARGTELGDGVVRVVHVADVGLSATVTSIATSVAAALIDSSGVQYSTSNPVPVDDAGGSLTIDGTVTVDSITNSVAVALVGSGGVQYSGSNPVPVGGTITGITNSVAVSLIDSSGVQYETANPVPVGDAGGSLTIDGTVTVASITASSAVSLIDSSGIGYSGSNPVPIGDAGGSLTVDGTVAVSGITNSVASALIDSSGVQYSTANPVPIGDAGGSLTIDGTVTGITNSVAVYMVDSGGVGYNGSNPMSVTGSLTSAVVVGPVVSDAADGGSAPVKTGGIARTANPTAVAANDMVSATFDDLGRQVMVPMQVRDLRVTAYATLNSNAETTLIAASAGNLLDLVWIKFSNTSSGAVNIDLRPVSGGNIVDTFAVPANSSNGIAMPIPYPQNDQGNAWTVDFNTADVSNTTVYVSGLFIKEI